MSLEMSGTWSVEQVVHIHVEQVLVSCPVDIGVGVKQVSHSNNIGSFTQTSPWCLLAASMYLLPAGFAALMVLLSSEVSFFLLLEGFFAVVASIILVVYTQYGCKVTI